MSNVPPLRRRLANDRGVNPAGSFVLYWMLAYRRTSWSFALDRAVELGQELNKPVVILEALRCDYPWASDRLHRFVLDGILEKHRRLASTSVLYYPYLEPEASAGKGLLPALSRHACAVVTDDYPCLWLPRAVAAAAERSPVRFEVIDSNGLLPLRAGDRLFSVAHSFRRHLQRHLAEHLRHFPSSAPLAARLPRLQKLPPNIVRRWPPAATAQLTRTSSHLSELPIDHSVAPTASVGGTEVARARLREFLDSKIDRYDEEGRHPDLEATSGLSPYLHFGHLSTHEIVTEIWQREQWSLSDLGDRPTGRALGWWGLSESAETFLDQLVTWRELGFNMCWQTDEYTEYESLPDWAKRTLAKHAADPRPHLYQPEDFANARTHDELWNAAQRQLLCEGRIHNYLRMLWGKKILEWSASPQAAVEIMIDLNDKYALDGRDPNSYSGIFWTLGRYDRAWGERPIFGKVRYMSSQNTRRKLRLQEYLKRFSGEGGEGRGDAGTRGRGDRSSGRSRKK